MNHDNEHFLIFDTQDVDNANLETEDDEKSIAQWQASADVDEEGLCVVTGGVITPQQEEKLGAMMKAHDQNMTRTQAMGQVGIGTAMGFGLNMVGNMIGNSMKSKMSKNN